MHELAITQSMFDIVLKQAEKAQAKKVTKINLVIGEMTGVVGDSVQFYLEFLSKGTVAEGTAVSVTMIPPKAQCRNCRQTFELAQFEQACPNCKKSGMDIVAGNELFVESIEVD
jgi:hydrogenase nickel incorporation protein HypA/HybF